MKRVLSLSSNSIKRTAFALACLVANLLLSLMVYKVSLPLYLDTIGTMSAAFVGGTFPGLMIAVLTNIVCLLYNPQSAYFSIVNVLVALVAAFFVRKKLDRKFSNVVLLGLLLGVMSGAVSSIIQEVINGEPQLPMVKDTVNTITASSHMPYLLAFIIVNVFLNIIDKLLSVAAAVAIYHAIPGGFIRDVTSCNWKQRLLSDDEVSSMGEWSRDIGYSIRLRLCSIIIAVLVSILLIIGTIGTKIYYNNYRNEKIQVASNAARFAAEIIDPDAVGDYMHFGVAAEGYTETRAMLEKIRDNANGVKFLYVLKIEDENCRVVFDLETEDTEAWEPGDIVPFEEAFMPYIDALKAGEEIEPIESDDTTGLLLTVYHPVRDDKGNCVCYVGADISLENMRAYARNFGLRTGLIVSGFIIFLIAFVIWETNAYIVYPINTIARNVEKFIRNSDDQKTLDENVRKIRAIDIRTDDETQKLYEAICEMALNTSEQMRSMRYYTESTSRMQNGLIVTMADLVENRDSDTGAHVQKTSEYARIIVEGLKRKGYYAEKITPKFMSDVVMSAPLHDVGKINIPDAILNKPGKLTDDEYAIMKTHTTAGKEIIEKAINTVNGESYLKEARNMAAYHHERWDGKGYPQGLHGQVIPLAARIMSVADVFDALASPRVYKPAFPLEKALAIIEEGAGTQFDPKCVEVFMESLDEVKAVLRRFQD